MSHGTALCSESDPSFTLHVTKLTDVLSVMRSMLGNCNNSILMLTAMMAMMIISVAQYIVRLRFHLHSEDKHNVAYESHLGIEHI